MSASSSPSAWRHRLLVLGAALALGATACDRRVEPYVSPDDEPPAPERPVRIPALARPSPQVPELGGPQRQGAPDPGAAPGIRGVVRLADGVASPTAGVLFVIARGPAPGPPLAVKRLAPGPFPLEFAIGQADVMVPGLRFGGPIQLSARVDSDGDPLSRGDDDLTAELPGALDPGASGVELVLRPAGP